jgi:hypothetical protein
MNALKQKILDELMEHLSNAQGGDLKSMLDESKKPSLEMEGMGEGKPKGLKIESVELMGKPKASMHDDKVNEAIEEATGKKKMDPMSLEEEGESKIPGEEEMSDSELEELIKKYLS